MRIAWQLEAFALCFAVPFLSELKISWAFAAAPLHFQHHGWPLWAFGATISLATLGRVAMNATLIAFGDWLILPTLLIATAGAAYMLVEPLSLAAVVAGVAAGHLTDTCQVQASLCYRWRIGEEAAQKRALRLQAFSATFGYSSGALLGGALYEHGGFRGCAVLQLGILAAMAAMTALLPVVQASCRDSRQRCGGGGKAAAAQRQHEPPPEATAQGVAAAAPAATSGGAEVEEALSIVGTNGWLLLPASLVWVCDGANIFVYICEWSLFAVYFADAYEWSSTLTGAAQMAGDLLAAAVLALTTTALWARLLRTDRTTRVVDRLLLQPPWNLGAFFGLYAATFVMLAQPIFALSVAGQVVMGTIYVFNKQAVQECYVALSHRSLALFRKLEFVGSCAFNLFMAASTTLAVVIYERVSMTAPFYMVAAVSGCWAAVVVGYWCVRLRGRIASAESFAAAEDALLERLRRRRAPARSGGGGVACTSVTFA